MVSCHDATLSADMVPLQLLPLVFIQSATVQQPTGGQCSQEKQQRPRTEMNELNKWPGLHLTWLLPRRSVTVAVSNRLRLRLDGSLLDCDFHPSRHRSQFPPSSSAAEVTKRRRRDSSSNERANWMTGRQGELHGSTTRLVSCLVLNFSLKKLLLLLLFSVLAMQHVRIRELFAVQSVYSSASRPVGCLFCNYCQVPLQYICTSTSKSPGLGNNGTSYTGQYWMGRWGQSRFRGEEQEKRTKQLVNCPSIIIRVTCEDTFSHFL